jgi:hypothetical protein
MSITIRMGIAAVVLAATCSTAFAESARVLVISGDWRVRSADRAVTLDPSTSLEAGSTIFPTDQARPGHIVLIYCDLSTRVYKARAEVATCDASRPSFTEFFSAFKVVAERFRKRLAKGGVRGIDLPERVIAITAKGGFALDRLGVSPTTASRVTLTPIAADGTERGSTIGPFAPSDGPPSGVLRPGLYRIALVARGAREIGDPGWVLLVDAGRAAAFEKRFAEMEALSRDRVEPGLDADLSRQASAMFLRASLGVLAADLNRQP